MDSVKVAGELVKMAKMLAVATRMPKSVKRWYETLKGEGNTEKQAIKRAIQRAYEEGDISEGQADKLERQFRVVKGRTADDSLLSYVLDHKDVLKLEDVVDEETWDLARRVYVALKKRLQLDRDTKEAINRLKNSASNVRGFQPATHRNNIFKAAHALGIKLPSSSF